MVALEEACTLIARMELVCVASLSGHGGSVLGGVAVPVSTCVQSPLISWPRGSCYAAMTWRVTT